MSVDIEVIDTQKLSIVMIEKAKRRELDVGRVEKIVSDFILAPEPAPVYNLMQELYLLGMPMEDIIDALVQAGITRRGMLNDLAGIILSKYSREGGED